MAVTPPDACAYCGEVHEYDELHDFLDLELRWMGSGTNTEPQTKRTESNGSDP